MSPKDAYISAVVKGDRFTVARAAAERGIAAAYVREHRLFGTTVFNTCPASVSALASWLAEPSGHVAGHGFPIGTLLLYTNHNGA